MRQLSRADAHRREAEGPPAGCRFSPGPGDNSNTQFALLGLWAAGRHGFDSDLALESIDRPLPVVAAPRRPLGLSSGHVGCSDAMWRIGDTPVRYCARGEERSESQESALVASMLTQE